MHDHLGISEHPPFPDPEPYEALVEVPVAELRARIAVGLEQADLGELRDGEEVFQELEARLASADSAS